MTDLLRFHVRIYARPAAVTAEQPRQIGEVQITPLRAKQADLLSSWPITFDAASERLSQLPRMFLEPDGSFVWVSGTEPAWQIDGLLYDRGPHLAYVELRGCCPAGTLDALLRTVGWPEVPLGFELISEGTLLAEADFRSLAGRESR